MLLFPTFISPAIAAAMYCTYAYIIVYLSKALRQTFEDKTCSASMNACAIPSTNRHVSFYI